MSAEVIFLDTDRITKDLAGPRADAAKIQAVLDLIGEIATPDGYPTAPTGLDLIKKVVRVYNGADYLKLIMVVPQGQQIIQDALAGLITNYQGQTMDLNQFILNEDGNVIPVNEAAIILENTYSVENDLQAAYIEKAEAFAAAYNDLDAFLFENKMHSIYYNQTTGHGDRFDYTYRQPGNWATLATNLRVVNEFK